MNLKKRAEFRRRNLVGNIAKDNADAEKWDLEFWQNCTPQQRLSALVDIHRDIARVRHGKRER
ncbi:MAG: hypothetical protein GF398_08255 [Chitinivibrionales bacterium]|nr:hypothetical protein [Chitinivibrionales bacterium]